MAPVRQFFSALLDVLLPPVCHVCHTFIPDAGTLHICPACYDRLPPVQSPLCPICGIPFVGKGGDHRCGACLTHHPHFDTARAPFLYEGAVRDLIHRFKYGRMTHLRKPLALLMLEGFARFEAVVPSHLIVPVPLHSSRLRQRGFNQAVLLGSLLSRRLSLPLEANALVRTRPTEPQIELPALERRLNVKGAFTVTRPAAVAGKRVLLLDDVMTTGSTLDECAQVLKKAGAAEVMAITVARTARN